MKNRLKLTVLVAVFGLIYPLSGCDDGKKSIANNTNLCGNDQVDTGEACDGADLNGYTCEDLLEGFTGGTLACYSTCQMDTSGCTTNCTNVCTLGSTQCNTAGTGVETCVNGVSGCTEWSNAPCDAGTPLCQLDGGLPTCVIDCTGSCTLNSTRCTAEFDGIETCGLGASGCGEWTAADCAPETPDCAIQGGGAVCVNNCVDECTADEVRCNDAGDGVETCITGVTGCTEWSNVACGVATPLCEIRDAAPTCVVDCGVHECAIGQYRCNTAGDAIVSCIADADGCPELQTSACDVSTPFCEVVSTVPTCLETCLDDCTLDAVRCNDTANGIETCITGANGCTEWSNAACAPAIPDCQDIDGTPTCLYTNGSGESCADVFRVQLPLWVQGADFTADYTTQDLVFTDASCTSLWLGSGPEAVFSYEMTSGETVVFAQGLGLDGQLLIQGTCSASGVCLDTADSGVEDDIESITFTAPAAGTYYFIAKSYSASPNPSTYGIALYAYEASGELTCDDWFDNDGDGLFDCEDTDCDGVGLCGAENTLAFCADLFDNDGDGTTDCADTECNGVGLCGTENTLAFCADLFDNDGDGATDCADSECNGVGFCGPENTPENCSDSVDNDGDGATDCADYDCAGIGSCPPPLLVEEFETWPPAGWTISDGGDTGYTWESSAGFYTLAGSTGEFAIVDSDYAGTGIVFDDSLISPVLDCTAFTTVTLSFIHYYNDWSTYDSASVEVTTNGSTWTPVITYTADTIDGATASLDLSALAAGQATVQFRFHYIGSYDYYWLIDNVVVMAN